MDLAILFPSMLAVPVLVHSSGFLQPSLAAARRRISQACLQVKHGLAVSGSLEIHGCHNDANDDEGRGNVIGGCLNASSLFMEDRLSSNCTRIGCGSWVTLRGPNNLRVSPRLWLVTLTPCDCSVTWRVGLFAFLLASRTGG